MKIIDAEMPMAARYQFLHSTYKYDAHNKSDALVMTLKDLDTGESSLRVARNPNRRIWITKPALRSLHAEKKEHVPLSEVDEYLVPNSRMVDELKVKLGHKVNSYIPRQALINNPYVYGANIDISTLAKLSYFNKHSDISDNITVGALDIETSVITATGEIILNTYVSHEHKVFCAILQPFMKSNTLDDIKECVDKSLKLFRANLNKKGRGALDSFQYEIEYKVCKTEAETITWIFEKIHQEKDDFISVWNVDYDVPYMLKRLEALGINPITVMPHPDVPNDVKVCDYREDKTPVDKLGHWSRRWHFFNLSGYSQFIDSMCLYSRLRVVDGLEPSYTLKAIANKILGTGKLDFGEDGHAVMQADRFVEYTAYNIVDTLLLPIFNKVTNDVQSMLLLNRDSALPAYSQQTKILTNRFYNYCLQNEHVSASCAGDQTMEGDELIKNTGGGVLSPSLMVGTISKVAESPAPTSLHVLVADIDVEDILRGVA